MTERLKLSEKELLLVAAEMQYKRKDLSAGYLLLLILGIFGGHRFYLKKTISAWVMLICTLTTILIPVTIIWLIIDLYLYQDELNKFNQEIEKELIRQYTGITKNGE